MPAPIQVLHVDDDQGLLGLTADFLEREDDRLSVETATSAAEGFDAVSDRPPDCIVSDYDMPGQNGIEFLNNIRDECPDLPFILYTGKGSEEVASEAISNGATDYLQKGSGSDRYELLANRIKNAVEQYRSNHQAANLERIRQLVADINQGLLRATSPKEVETQVCQLISGSKPYVTTCIADVDRDTMEIEPQTWAGDTAGYFEALDMCVDEESPGRHAPGGRAFHDREIAVSQNIQDDDRYASWREAALERGFQSLAVVPIEYEDELHGLLATFASRPNAFDQTERELLVELAGDIGHALHGQQIQTELERAERRYQSLLNDPNFLAGILDTDGTLVEQNQTGIEYIDAKTGDVVGEPFWETPWWPEDFRPVLRRKIKKAANGEYATYEADLTKPDGNPYNVSGVVRPVTNDDGQVVSLVVSARDVTDKKEREQEVQETAARLEALFENSPDMINIHDTDGDIITPNPRLCESTGYDASELVEMKVWELDQTIDPDKAYDLWTELEIGERRRLNGVYQCRDGSTFPVEIHVRRINIEGADRFVAIARNVSDRKERQRNLVRYERIIEYLDDIATIIEPDGTITYVSPSVKRVLGYDPEELIGEDGFGYQPETTAEAVADAIEYVIENPRESRTIQTKFRQKDGSFCWIESTLRNQLEDDVIGGILVGSRDITERKTHQEQLERQNKRLDQFASVVSHDLRNPLNVAQGRLELVREEYASPHLDATARAHDRMEALIEDLLTLAHQGTRISETDPADLAEVVETCWQNVETADARVDTDVDRTIEADQSQLAQLFENLIRNAIEHGGEDVTVTVEKLDDGFYVEDDGPGIPAENRNEVFDARYSTAKEGTGFGLSIVKQVADAHGWNIHVTEGTEGGARFEITGVDTVE